MKQPADPRFYQVACQSTLLTYGLLKLDFPLVPLQIIVLLASVLGFQFLFTKLFKLPAYEPKSALASGLSLCLLFRTNSLALLAFAAFFTIASKFLIRFNQRHLFNPTNFSIVAMLLLFSEDSWVSPGQWGNVAFFGFLLACLGGLVVYRSSRWDLSIAFLIFYSAILFGRSYLLGEPFTIPWHRLQSGGILLFSFFMISDPKTTPDSRIGRILFAFLVSLGAWYVQFKLFRTNGPLWSLAFFSMCVPLLNRVFPGESYEWKRSVYEKNLDLGNNGPVFGLR